MLSKIKYLIFLILLPLITCAQVRTSRMLRIEDLFSLADSNSKALAISRKNIEADAQRTGMARSERLPEITASVDAGYLGNVTILNPNFSLNEKVPVPHFSNNYSLEAGQILYNGNRIRNNIKRASLQEELSGLDYANDRESIRILLLGQYLELYRLYNQQKVYAGNIKLARVRLKNIQGLHTEGMVTKNDIIRSELQLTDLDVAADQVDNNISIVNKELTLVLGLPAVDEITIDTTLNAQNLENLSYSEYLNQGFSNAPAMRASPLKEDIAKRNLGIAKAEKLPIVSLYAGNAMSRPFLYVLPPQDIYFNLYQAGVRVRYNISSLYHAKEKIHLAEIEQSQEMLRTEQTRQQTELAINSAFIRYNEAKRELDRREKARLLAEDNYRIVEKKYFNQLALLTDILDASSAKLSAELNRANANINIIYQWYQLQKATGKL